MKTELSQIDEKDLYTKSHAEIEQMVKDRGMTPRGGRNGCIELLLSRGANSPAKVMGNAVKITTQAIVPKLMASVSASANKRTYPASRPTTSQPLKLVTPLVLGNQEDRLISVPETATMLGVSPRKIWQMFSSRSLTKLKHPSTKRTLVSLSEVQEYIAKLRRIAHAEN